MISREDRAVARVYTEMLRIAAMSDNVAFITALMDLTNMIALIRAPEALQAIYDPYVEDQPFNLATYLGENAFPDMSEGLKDSWDGTVASFPSFVLKLRLRVTKGKWNNAAPRGGLTINAYNLLTDYHSIIDAQITTERAVRADNYVIQNFRAMLNCIKASISGDLLNTILGQYANIPTHTDGPSLFKELTSLLRRNLFNCHYYSSPTS